MIALVLSKPTLEENLEDVKKNRNFIDICELRVDLLEEEEKKKASLFPSMVDIPVILTIRREEDGGKWKGEEKNRKALFLKCLDGDFSYIDLEEDIKKNEVESKARTKGVKIIRSFHDFSGLPEDIVSKVAKLRKRGDVAKLAITPRSMKDVIAIFRASDELKGVEKILIGMGDYGVPTRILYKRLGSMLTFSSENAVAPGQFSPEVLKNLYRSDKVDEKTAIYGVVGNPVMHTSSPLIHNPGFHQIHYNAIYLPFLSDNIQDFLRLAEYLKIHGFSVTIPFKVDVLSYLGNITREVKQIGSCNTVIRLPNMWKGINTDYYGFLSPIMHDIEKGRVKNALVIGAGGASKAVVWGLRNMGVKVTILNRTISHAESLARLNFCQYDTLDNAFKYEGKVDLVVQTTSVGLAPNFGTSPIENFHFTGKEIVYDIIYRPKYTKLLREAEKAGCTLHFGEEMLFDQGKLQFEAFTGYHYPSSLKPEI